jgi:hydrophobic/amphiphilic exporter-1 (mainly G- bacteria), HAE1 family
MKEHYITIQEVISAIRLQNRNIPAGELERGYQSLSIRFVGEFQSPDEIRDMVLTSSDGRKFHLKDIAVVEDSFKKIESIARYNGKDVVGLSLIQVSDGNAVAIARQLERRLDRFRGDLPGGVSLDVATDNTRFLIRETNDTLVSILIGILLTLAILYLFTARLNLTFIAIVVIPTSLISTFSLMSASGFSINFITLLAIATSMGTLIANAIVIVENVLLHLEHKESSIDAAIDGTKEVSGTVFAATGTNLVVFTPIAMMGGIAGEFMRSFGLTVVYATLFSLLASFTLTPMLCALLLKERRSQDRLKSPNPFSRYISGFLKKIDNMVEFLKREYKVIFELIFSYPKTTILSVVFLFISIGFIMPFIDNEFSSASDEDKVGIQISLPQGSTIERTLSVVREIEGYIDRVPEKSAYLVNIGKDGPENANIILDLVPAKKRARSDLDIINSLIPLLSGIPDIEVHLARPSMRGDLESGDISINIYGIDYDKIIELSKKAKEIMEDSGYFRSVSSSYKIPKSEIEFIPDQDSLIEYGLSSGYVGMVLRSSIYGDDSNIYKEAGEEYDINIELDSRYTETPADIKEISLFSPKGLIPLDELGSLRQVKAVPAIRHRDKNRIISLEGYLSKGALGLVRNILNREFSKIDFPQGYGYSYAGQSEFQEDASREIGRAFILAVILTYMLLAAILNSFIYPIPILLTVATSFIGVFYALFFLGHSINIASMLTMVMLVGLVVNNAILLLDYTLLKIREGVAVKEALWLGASVKFRAILMTSFAVIFALLPQLKAYSSAKQSMGVVMIGGMVASIIFSFIFVPLVFWYLEGFKNRKRLS